MKTPQNAQLISEGSYYRIDDQQRVWWWLCDEWRKSSRDYKEMKGIMDRCKRNGWQNVEGLLVNRMDLPSANEKEED